MAWSSDEDALPGFVFADSLAALSGVRHAVTTRGSADAQSNISFTVPGSLELVRAARIAACERLGFRPTSLVFPEQVHGVGVATIGEGQAGPGALLPGIVVPDCDALVTATPGILLGITVADCLPVFIVDPDNGAIGLAHSGWRGTAGEIAVRTLDAMNSAFGSRAERCRVAIGPGISPDGYEVDSAVYGAFSAATREAPGVFRATRPGRHALDLASAVGFQMRRAGVPEAQIDVSPWRTDHDTTLFFSHRRHPGCPRMGAFLGLVI